jgi:hypothetical protein
MDAGDELLTKVYDKEVVGVNIGSVRRWLDTDGKFTVQGRTSADSDDWTYILYQINAYDRKTGGGVNPMPNPFGCHQVRITQLSDGAQSIIDDVTIYMAADTTYTPVEGKTNLNAGDATTLRVQGLEYDTTYYYTVTAHSDTESSLESDYVKVTTDVFTGVDNVAADNATTVSVDQLTATVTAGNDTTVAIYTPSGVTVVAPEQLAAGTTATYQLPATGIYLVKVGRTTYKISAK